MEATWYLSFVFFFVQFRSLKGHTKEERRLRKGMYGHRIAGTIHYSSATHTYSQIHYYIGQEIAAQERSVAKEFAREIGADEVALSAE